LLDLEWPGVEMRRREFALRETKNRETRVVSMTADVFDVFAELDAERRLDTQKVFLYKGKPWKNQERLPGDMSLHGDQWPEIAGFSPYREHKFKTGRIP
jgi:hypothetical protein